MIFIPKILSFPEIMKISGFIMYTVQKVVEYILATGKTGLSGEAEKEAIKKIGII